MIPSEQKDISSMQPTEQPGWDAMMEDLLGLNIRGVQTALAIFATPRKVYSAAHSKDWQARTYTPSLRLFISLVMFVLILQAFWGGPDSHLARFQTEVIQAGLNANAPEALLPFIDARDIWETSLVSLPVATVSAMLVASLLLRVWGKGTNTVTRIRFYFLSAIPGWIVSFAVSVIANQLTYTTAIFIVGWMFYLIIMTDAFSAWRGNAGQHQGMARVWRAGLFAVTNTIAYTTGAIIMNTYAVAVVSQKATEAALAAGVVLTPS